MTMATGRQVEWRLSAVEFDVLWREFGRGIPPYPLDLPSPGTTYDERAEIVAEVWGELASRGIVDAGSERRLPPDLDHALTLLATGEVTIDGLVDVGERGCLLAARSGTNAVVVTQHDEERLVMRTMDAARLSGVLVELFPPVPPAHGQSVSLPHKVLAPALEKLAKGEGDGWEFEQALREAGVSARDVRWIIGLAQGDQSHAVQLGVNVRGKRMGVLSWYATEQGGVLVHRQAASGGDWVTITPGDPARLVARLEEFVTGQNR